MTYADEMKQYIKEAIIEKFGKIDDLGCYCDNGNWLSTESLFDVVCETIDDYDYLFEDDD